MLDLSDYLCSWDQYVFFEVPKIALITTLLCHEIFRRIYIYQSASCFEGFKALYCVAKDFGSNFIFMFLVEICQIYFLNLTKILVPKMNPYFIVNFVVFIIFVILFIYDNDKCLCRGLEMNVYKCKVDRILSFINISIYILVIFGVFSGSERSEYQNFWFIVLPTIILCWRSVMIFLFYFFNNIGRVRYRNYNDNIISRIFYRITGIDDPVRLQNAIDKHEASFY